MNDRFRTGQAGHGVGTLVPYERLAYQSPRPCGVRSMPDRSEQVDATLLNVGSHSWMRCVKVAQDPLGVPRENGNS